MSPNQLARVAITQSPAPARPATPSIPVPSCNNFNPLEQLEIRQIGSHPLTCAPATLTGFISTPPRPSCCKPSPHHKTPENARICPLLPAPPRARKIKPTAPRFLRLLCVPLRLPLPRSATKRHKTPDSA